MSSDGRLKVDKLGEVPVVVHEADVSAEDLAAAIEVLTDPAFVALLAGPRPVCEGFVADLSESMRLTFTLEEFQNQTPACDKQAIVAARDRMRLLADTYVP